MRSSKLFFVLLFIYSSTSFAQTEIIELDLWRFSKGENIEALQIDFDDSDWNSVKPPMIGQFMALSIRKLINKI